MWLCIQCKTEYDLTEIEQNLVDAVNRSSMAYALQDVACGKCHQVLYVSSTVKSPKDLDTKKKLLLLPYPKI